MVPGYLRNDRKQIPADQAPAAKTVRASEGQQLSGSPSTTFQFWKDPAGLKPSWLLL